MAGVYVHIPFCKSFCIYCDFFSVLNREKTSSYIDAILNEIELRRDFFGNTPPTTLYFGGGTPSLLTPEQLKTISSAIISTFFQGASPSEFTIEVNPDDITPEYAAALCAVGANRISMGVQSFDDAHLKWMRRRHSASGAKNAYRLLREAGFKNISLDLIFGYVIPGENEEEMDSWMEDLRSITELHPEHISAYQMSIEPGSALGQMGSKYAEPSQEFCARQYSCLQRELLKSGYIQYEISNFALPGYHSRHNSSYWEREPYIGLGAAAHSFSERKRSWNPSSIEEYLSSNAQQFSETLSDEEVLEETLMLGLRKAEGIEYRPIKNLPALVQRGLLLVEDGRIRIPQDKFFISDYIISELF